MHRTFATFIALLLSGNAVQAQSNANSQLIAKIKANRSFFSDLDRGSSLSERAQAQGKDISVRHVVFETPSLCDSCPPADPANHPDIKRATLAADLVAVGHVTRTISALTANEAFVFTDSQFVIDQVWSTSPKVKSVSNGDEITIVTPGGSVMSNGHKLTASVSNQKALTIGHSYLLFLKYLPNSESYSPVSLIGFDVSNEVISSLNYSVEPPAKELISDKTAFVQAVHASVARANAEELR